LLIFFNLLLVIIHPFAPFVTEKMFNNFNPNKSIMLEKISKIINFPKNKYIFEIDIITEILFLAKKIRINNSFKKNDLLEFNIICNHELHVNLLNKYLSMHSVHVDQQKVKKTFATTIFTFNNFSVEFLNNKKNEKENDGLLEKKLANLKLELERSEKILNNNNFLNKASKEKINEEKKKQKNYKEQYEQVINKINELKKNK
jgi:valyl-tRNA synthetase